MKRIHIRIVLACAMLMLPFLSTPAQEVPGYQTAQAREGEREYNLNCTACHGPELTDGTFGPPLAGTSFQQRWAGRDLEELFTYLHATMPPGLAGQISNRAYAAIIAYMLEKNGIEATGQALPVQMDVLHRMVMPGERLSDQDRLRLWSPGGPISSGVALPSWPVPHNPIDDITPVTDAMKANPAPGDWLTWRRSYDDMGFSPLGEINRDNVKNLRLAWSLSLPPGPNTGTPLVHDGVIFVLSYGDHIQALDAATGAEIWHYGRLLGDDQRPGVKRNLALHGDRVYIATSDDHVVALDSKTGKVVWDQPVADANPRWSLTSGPLIADGIVMQGIQGQGKGGSYVVGLDAATGKELWRFHTIARPGQPGGDSWNGLAVEERSGGSVWTSGSYDPELGLAFFGPAPTYDTAPLRDPVNKPGITNDALYTNATIALKPKTGELVWFYQHLANDQWDMDWSFERHILNLQVNGKMNKVVVTGGKEAVFDILEAATGKYITSFDLGLQNLITGIDPVTGNKTIDPALIPYGDKTITICPHGGGAKSWIPGSINPETNVLYVPLVESCADLVPTQPGQLGLSSGVRYTIRPPLETDGRYGRIQAINLATRETLWTQRQRAPQTTGVVATAGNLIFAGALDRWFTAYDATNGKVLWRNQLNDVPSSAPISYLAGGKQYVAMVVGYGSGHSVTFPKLTPEIDLPHAQSSTIWVFALPEE
jgi:alcohol dehydrogenase (cytochrome c)